MFLLLSGENTITLKGLCADGSIVEKNFPINVDKIHYAIDPAYGLLFGSGEKVWKWAETDCLGMVDGVQISKVRNGGNYLQQMLKDKWLRKEVTQL